MDVAMRKKLLSLLVLACLPAYSGAADALDCATDGPRLQQLRIYEVNRENRDPFHQRFQDHALRIMKKYGFDVIDMWESDTGEKLQFIYALDWPDRATMESAWKAFLADAEWIDIKKRSADLHGQLVHEAKGQSLERVVYSPACRKKK
jgi:hypothetical protein